MTWPEIWQSEKPGAVFLRTLLTPLSWLYSAGWRVYAGLYSLGIKKAKRPHSPVICVGNLVVGGSGKTPLVVFLARLLAEMGYEVVISASGYGSPASEAARVAPLGALSPKEWGDEPALLREELPDVPLIVGRRRVLAAELCAAQFPKAVMLMDDGVQHLPLARDLCLIVDPVLRNRRCLPAGPYREPRLSSLNLFRGGRAVMIPGEFEVAYSGLEFSGERPERAGVLCALGNPEGFLQSVREAGVEVVFHRFLPDHDALDAGDLLAGFPEGPVIVSAKDWVKLRDQSLDREVIVARRSASIEPLDKLKGLLREVCG